uniref:U1-type domain-containing protein n=1 Tax=Paramormyrops kingsleyae TaxID=1676925 RepID=A0A3B3R1R0_9TELE
MMASKKGKDKSHLPSFITAKDRAKQYPSVLHESGGKLFCTPCNKVLDHRRKATINYHLQGHKHQKAAENSNRRRQIMMTKVETKSTVAAAERNKICEDWVRMCTALNIPLSKTDYPLVRQFLLDKVVNGGSIPKSHQLQEKHLGDLYLKGKAELKRKVSGKPVAVIFETPDVEGRCVLHILVAPLEKDDSKNFSISC